jgi:signal transduction histidine kinase
MRTRLPSWLFPASPRARLLWLVCLALLPALLLALYNAAQQRQAGLEAAKEETLRLARLSGEENDRLIDSAHQLLLTLAQFDEVRTRDGEACQRLFVTLLGAYGIYANITAAGPDGEVFASAIQTTNLTSLADRPFFQAATNSLDLVVGEYEVDSTTKKALLSLAQPVWAAGQADQLAAVVVITMNLDWVHLLHARARLPRGSSFTVSNLKRITLARYPDPKGEFVGQLLRPSTSRSTRPPAGKPPSSPTDLTEERAAIGVGRDGVQRLYGFAMLGTKMGTNSARITMGIPVSVMHASANRVLRWNLTFLGLVFVLALTAAWFGSDVFILRKVRLLLEATGRLQGGDLSARVGTGSERGELERLALAFDKMAEALQNQFADRVRAEEALRTLNQELEERVTERTRELKRSNQDLEQFAYVASHDLQEPLRMVTSYLNLIQKRYTDKLDQNAKEFIGFAAEGAERMHRLINDLLAFSRVQTRIEPFGPVNCNEVTDRVLDNLKVAIQESEAQVERPPLPTVLGDSSQLIQLFQNLISNAVKFRSAQTPRVKVSARQDGSSWVFAVEDNGIGISSKHFERIFIIFQRLHSRDKYTGTGIGLAICKKIIERHGGRIWVESEPGRGSTFYFTLPVLPAPEAQRA